MSSKLVRCAGEGEEQDKHFFRAFLRGRAMAKCIKLIVPALSCYCGAKEVFGVCGEDYLQL